MLFANWLCSNVRLICLWKISGPNYSKFALEGDWNSNILQKHTKVGLFEKHRIFLRFIKALKIAVERVSKHIN